MALEELKTSAISYLWVGPCVIIDMNHSSAINDVTKMVLEPTSRSTCSEAVSCQLTTPTQLVISIVRDS